MSTTDILMHTTIIYNTQQQTKDLKRKEAIISKRENKTNGLSQQVCI